MNTNQYPELVAQLQSEISSVKRDLRDGISPSQIANRLHASGLPAIHIMAVFMHATELPLRFVKEFGLWWGPNGVTDSLAFDERAQELLTQLDSGHPLT